MATSRRSRRTETPSVITMTIVATELGSVGLACTDGAVVAVQLPERDAATTRQRLLTKLARLPTTHRTAVPEARTNDTPGAVTILEIDEADLAGVAAQAADVLQRLLAGGDADITTVPVDLDRCSDFNRRVYTLVRTIPRATTMTYGQVAEAVGEPGGAQAVGRAMAANPVPILVPCHRVLGANRDLTGFSAHGGVDTKRRMLLIEGSTDVAPTLFDQLHSVGSTGQAHEPDRPVAR
jgi:methylated-DNA-[protein]-cysteine S-methyltransferase